MNRQLQSRFWLTIFLASMIGTAIPFSLPDIELPAIGGLGPCFVSDVKNGPCGTMKGETCKAEYTQWYCISGVPCDETQIPEEQCDASGCIKSWYNKTGDCTPGLICE